jgi:hypothetical protein
MTAILSGPIVSTTSAPASARILARAAAFVPGANVTTKSRVAAGATVGATVGSAVGAGASGVGAGDSAVGEGASADGFGSGDGSATGSGLGIGEGVGEGEGELDGSGSGWVVGSAEEAVPRGALESAAIPEAGAMSVATTRNIWRNAMRRTRDVLARAVRRWCGGVTSTRCRLGG